MALGLAACAGLAGEARADPAPAQSPADIAQDLRAFREFGSVLYVAAHPDDENTQLIAYLARGRAYRTAYLSLTRGDGGQNVLGPEFGDLLGVIRTQELLAARRVDGGRQFFSRARDFGYSKDYQQTLTKWDRQEVLSDIVRVIRTFRPDVVITRFPTEPIGTHGHHTASAVLALEAFRLSGDPKAFPEQLGALSPWQPRRILWNGWGPGRPGSAEAMPGMIHLSIDGTDEATGRSFARARGPQPFNAPDPGLRELLGGHVGQRPPDRVLQAAGGRARARTTSWTASTPRGGGLRAAPRSARSPTGSSRALTRRIPAASVPALLDLKGRLAKLAGDPSWTRNAASSTGSCRRASASPSRRRSRSARSSPASR